LNIKATLSFDTKIKITRVTAGSQTATAEYEHLHFEMEDTLDEGQIKNSAFTHKEVILDSAGKGIEVTHYVSMREL
jgi:hypothetical protein